MITLSLMKSVSSKTKQQTLLIGMVTIPNFFKDYSDWQFKDKQTYSFLKSKGLSQRLLDTSREILIDADNEIISHHPNRAKSMQARARRLTEASYILSAMAILINQETKIIVEVSPNQVSENSKKSKDIGKS